LSLARIWRLDSVSRSQTDQSAREEQFVVIRQYFTKLFPGDSFDDRSVSAWFSDPLVHYTTARLFRQLTVSHADIASRTPVVLGNVPSHAGFCQDMIG